MKEEWLKVEARRMICGPVPDSTGILQASLHLIACSSRYDGRSDSSKLRPMHAKHASQRLVPQVHSTLLASWSCFAVYPARWAPCGISAQHIETAVLQPARKEAHCTGCIRLLKPGDSH